MRNRGWFGLTLVVVLASHLSFGQDRARPTPAGKPANAPSTEEAKATLQQKLIELEALQAEITRLRAVTGAEPKQILIRVQVLEISRTMLERLGYDVGDGGVVGFLSRSTKQEANAKAPSTGAEGEPAKPSASHFAILKEEGDLKKLLQSWKKEGAVVRVLAEPNVVTVSGRPAFFRVGGQFPRLMPSTGGSVKTDMQFYGTQLNATPVLLADGRVRLELRPSISEIDDNRTIEVHGIKIPGLHLHEIDTGVELSVGETLAVSGMTQVRRRAEQGEQTAAEDKHPQRPLEEQVELLVLANVELVDAMIPTADSTNRSGSAAGVHSRLRQPVRR